MKNNKNGLTIKQKEFILENYSTMKSSEICEILAIEYKKLSSYAVSRKLKKNPNVRNDKGESFDNYIDARKNIKGYDIYNFLNNKKEPKIEKDKLFKSKYGKYFINQDYFNIIDNEWKAYWLGFIYADGCVNKKKDTLKIKLNKNDKEHLFKFRDSIQSDTVITDSETKLNDKTFYSSTINVCNSKIVNSLVELNCMPNKSLILKFPNPNILPKELTRHFIRGYFDGDGWIHHSNVGKKRMEIGFMGTPSMTNGIKKYFTEEMELSDIGFKKNHGKDTTLSICYSRFSDCDKVFNHLYKDCNIYLERKLKKFDEILYLK